MHPTQTLWKGVAPYLREKVVEVYGSTMSFSRDFPATPLGLRIGVFGWQLLHRDRQEVPVIFISGFLPATNTGRCVLSVCMRERHRTGQAATYTSLHARTRGDTSLHARTRGECHIDYVHPGDSFGPKHIRRYYNGKPSITRRHAIGRKVLRIGWSSARASV